MNGSWEQLYITCVINGNMEFESKLYMQFNKDNIRGEWFNPSPELLSFINKTLIKNLPIEPDTSKINIKDRQHIIDTLKYHKSNKSHTAKSLGISRSTLYAKLKQINSDVWLLGFSFFGVQIQDTKKTIILSVYNPFKLVFEINTHYH